MSKPVVAITRCQFNSSDAEIAAAVRDTIALAGGIPEKVRTAKTILVKPNYVGANGKESDASIKRYRGRFVSCSEPAVVHAVVGLLREANPGAEILVAEGIDAREPRTPDDVFRVMGALALERDFGARLINANVGDLIPVPVPGGGLIHRSVDIRRDVASADAVVSIAKLKMHGTAGVTMSVKNMFGMLPRSRYGSTYRNFMHTNYFRLMRIVTDIATVLRPDLAVVDGLIASDHGMDHEPIETNLLFAGHDPVATDAVGSAILGFDPTSEFPTMPFVVSENHLRLAARAGIGTLNLPGTEIRGLAIADARPKHRFTIVTESAVTTEQAIGARAAAIEQAAVYRSRRRELLREYSGKYIFLREGEVIWSADSLSVAADRAIEHLPAGEYGLALQVLPEELEVERVAAYA